MYYYLQYNKSLKLNISMMFKHVLFDDFDSMLLSSLTVLCVLLNNNQTNRRKKSNKVSVIIKYKKFPIMDKLKWAGS